MPSDYEMIDVLDAERTPSKVSGTSHVDLVSELGCQEMRPKVWFLSPGDEMSFHRQDEQEEFYYVIEGPGRIKLGDDEEIHDVSAGTAICVPPETPRQILNDTDGEHVWLVVGAPPTEDDGLPAYD